MNSSQGRVWPDQLSRASAGPELADDCTANTIGDALGRPPMFLKLKKRIHLFR